MPKAPKTGKGRLDKYYHLAKEQGYRARSAFKLVQINKKYNILARAKVLIDLCAAPGGWLQVAAKSMPAKSLIIGVDLVPIKPIPNVITHKEDITTDKCRAVLRQDLKTWKADVVLHDGAPNVGAAWVHDAYSQSELVLSSLKLAVEFLNKGGCFVTKVFRSKDYNNLMWVFNQLFGKVEATKPPSSRNVSAEIFVVCRDFVAPKRIDPKFLDPKHVFQDLEPTSSVMKPVDVFHPERATRHRDGYDVGDYTLHKTRSVVEFVKSSEPTAFLGAVNSLTFDDTPDSQLLASMPETTAEVRECVKDLKVLGKKDFKHLLKWRVAAREALNPKKPDASKDGRGKSGEDVQPEKEETVDLDVELEQLSKEEQTRQKRAKRKANERRAKELLRMQLNMTIPMEIGVEQSAGGVPDDTSNENLFDIERVRKKRGINFADEEDMDDERAMLQEANGDAPGESAYDEDKEDSAAESDVDNLDELDAELDAWYADYKERLSNRDAKYRARQSRAEDEEEWHGFSGGAGQNSGGDGSSSDEDSGDDDMSSERHASDKNSDSEGDVGDAPAAASVRGKGGKPGKLSRDAAVFFDNPLFKEVEDSEEAELGTTPAVEKNISSEKEITKTPKRASTKRKIEEVDGAGDGQEEEEESEDGIEIVARERENDVSNGGSDVDVWNGDSDDESSKKRKPDYTLMAAEAMTLAQQLVSRQKTKADLVDEGFNRYAFNDTENLPEWFLDDERKHNRRQMPITKEAAEAIKARLRALDARPIKKIVEAKARKKQKAVQQYNKMVKKTEALVENPEMSERSKAQNVAKILAKGKRKPKKEVKLVVAKGANRGNKGRPKGVKGRYKMVDARMKKEVRAEKRKQTKGKKKQKR